MAQTPVLYVEDEPNDAMLLRIGFERAGVGTPLEVVTDGRDAIEYLSGSGRYSDRRRYPLPCLVLLDLNLPVVSGFDALAWMRTVPALKQLPVVVFSSSSDPMDMQRARELGANDYLVKPVDMSQMHELIRGLRDRWLINKPESQSVSCDENKPGQKTRTAGKNTHRNRRSR